MEKHTPGPWTNNWIMRGPTPIVGQRANGEMIPGIAGVICHIPEGCRNDEGAANCSLIAAAPELLEACKACVPLLTTGLAADLIRAAIAKAEGKTA
jgi:hypothetical protein